MSSYNTARNNGQQFMMIGKTVVKKNAIKFIRINELYANQSVSYNIEAVLEVTNGKSQSVFIYFDEDTPYEEVEAKLKKLLNELNGFYPAQV